MRSSFENDNPPTPLSPEERESFYGVIDESFTYSDQQRILDMVAATALIKVPALEGQVSDILEGMRTPGEKVEDVFDAYEDYFDKLEAEQDQDEDEDEGVDQDDITNDDLDGLLNSWVDRGIEAGRPEAFYARGAQYGRWRVLYSKIGRSFFRAMAGYKEEL